MPALPAPETESATARSAEAAARPRVGGKFLFAGSEKLLVRGVTYGTFRPDERGEPFPAPEVVAADFESMAENGLNAVRMYTPPPAWLLDAAARSGLRVMVGLPWEEHVTFLDERGRARAIEGRIRDAVRAAAGHPAVLCYAVGNEIPAPIVRWHGRRKVEDFVERLAHAAKAEDPEGLVTYVNYPSTEYLSVPSLDFVSFNVYLETPEQLRPYLARLQNLAGDRPLVMGEIGLDSRRNGEAAQAEVLAWQVRSAFAAGCAGAFVFGWTDEWHRGGHDVEDWDFGVTDRARSPKPALAAIRSAFAEAPFPAGREWPFVSVVVCTHNGARTLRETLAGLERVDYPGYEVIVVDDGSTDESAAIAAEFGARVIQTPNRGLSSARNTGLAAARGAIVAYLDDDAWPDPHWLAYLAHAFDEPGTVAAGGPNIPPPSDPLVAQCVAKAPGGPIHVLVSDDEAEHLPGCNMAVLREELEAIGGFDPQFRVAGDDVDACWRLQERGKLRFAPAAVVWHRRRASIGAYWRQQVNYGKAEALLERKWPERYNALGHVSWRGRVYGGGLAEAIGRRAGRIYHGIWGTAPFQSVYQPGQGLLQSLPMLPDWYLLVVLLAAVSAAGSIWPPLLAAIPLLVLAAGVPFVQAVGSGAAIDAVGGRHAQTRMRLLVAALHFLQPLARLIGRVTTGLTPWRLRGWRGLAVPRPRRVALWSERWAAPESRILAVERRLRGAGAPTLRGGSFDRWDLEVRGGPFGGARILTVVEEHGAGRQLTRFRVQPRPTQVAVALTAAALVLATLAAVAGTRLSAAVLAAAAALGASASATSCASATASALAAIEPVGAGAPEAAPTDADEPETAPTGAEAQPARPRRAAHHAGGGG